MQERVQVFMGVDHNYGTSFCVALPSSRQTTCLSKMSRPFVVADWIQSFGKSLRSGMMRNGIVYPLVPLVPHIAATGCGLLPTITASEWKGASSKRFRNSEHFHGSKMSEGLRISLHCPPYLNPLFGELAMGYPIGWTD